MIKWDRHYSMHGIRNASKGLVEKPDGERLSGRPRSIEEDN
jgi:hypothetical protein